MATFCLLKDKVDSFIKGLTSGEIDPAKLSEMTSAERHTFLEKYVGKDQAFNVNAEFESKLLLKNQQQGMITWAKQVTGIKPNVRRDIISRIEKMTEILTPENKDAFLSDLVERRLEVSVTADEAQHIANLSKNITESEDIWKSKLELNTKWSENPTKTRKEWINDTDRLDYGLKTVQMKNYVDSLKMEASRLKWTKEPFRKALTLPYETVGFMKSTLASLDNSFFGRQGIKTLLDPRKANIWARNFGKSFKNIGKQIVAKGKWFGSGDNAVMDMIKADILSRPNAVNGKYNAGGYGLNILGEEAFPSSLPEKIPLFGRLFKASQVAYDGGALQMRADLADNLIAKAEKFGVNTLNKDEAKALGNLVSSMTGRGSLGKADILGKEMNVFLFSGKFLKGNIDTLTMHIFDKTVRQSSFARKEAAKNLASIVATMAGVMTTANLLNPGSVELDPRNSNFGKIKIFGKWTDISGGMGGLVTLASRLVPTYHDGKLSFWTKSSKGEYIDLMAGKFGQQTAMDVFDSFWQGKLSPAAGIIRDAWKGQTYSGEKVSPETIIKGQIPLPIQNWQKFSQDPNASFALGSQILDGLGFGVSSNVESNLKTGYIPENKQMSNDNFIDATMIYANAIGTDPVTAFNRIFTGQKIRKVTNGAIIVERMSLEESTKVKKAGGGNTPEMKLEHLVPLEAGGSNDKSNLRLVTTAQWRQFTKVDNALGKALKSGKASKDEVQKLSLDVKNGKISAQSVLDKYK